MFKVFRDEKLILNKSRVLVSCVTPKKVQKSTNSSQDLAAAYVPNEVEGLGQASGYFEPPLRSPEVPFSLILPPPNITGVLHLGHALTVAIEDVLVRWNRMRGFRTAWVPGMDHAGIATQVVVEKRLWKERKQTRHELGRKLFEQEVWKWKEEKASIIGDQLRRLGASLDWRNEIFTMDPAQCNAVTEAFIKLYDSGLIYRSDYLVNWSCVLQSAISDIEVEYLQVSGATNLPVPGYEKPVQFGVLTKFAYKLCDSRDEVVVATTRPETMFGDVAVAVNPRDDRYSSLVGRNLWHPFRKEVIPIIGDDFVDPEFGTGAVKVTPGHNQVDFEVGRRHGLKLLQIIDEKGKLNDGVVSEFHGMPRFHARDMILDRLDRMNLLRGREDHDMTVPICTRSRDVVEFLVRPQWFVRCRKMATEALEDVRAGRITIEPRHFEKTWENWLENIRDWCVSRQLWWGHRIPVFSCTTAEDERKCWVAAGDPDTARSKGALKLSTVPDKVIVEQDEDVLDTWFSSALLPFTSFGWPQQGKALQDFYPLSLMETGHDIIFFWVARMVMLGKELTGELPFNKILLHGIVCDAHGRKMSKSLGNVITPEDVITGTSLQDLEGASKSSHATGILSDEELSRAVKGQRKMFPAGIPACGADALRFTLCSYNIKNHFINFSVDECNTNRLFCNKIWQATKFTRRWIENVSEAQTLSFQYESSLGEAPGSASKLSKMDRWILSRLSGMVKNVNEALGRHEFHLATDALRKFLYYDFCDVYLELELKDDELEREVQLVLDCVVAIRRLKKTFNVTRKHNPRVRVVSELLSEEFSGVVEDLTGCDKVDVVTTLEVKAEGETVSDSLGTHTIIHLHLPPEHKKALEVDMTKLEKKRTKLSKELEKFRKMTSAESYRIKADPDVQEGHAKKIAALEDELSRIGYMRTLASKG